MNLNYIPTNPRRLRSPLLDGTYKNKVQKENQVKGKRTYYTPSEENKINETIDETLDSTLFNRYEKLTTTENTLINKKLIDWLELCIKTSCIFITAIGGLISLLELINIIRIFYNGSSNFGSSIVVFLIAFIGTVLANIICLGFSHLIKTTKYIYLKLENH